MPRTEITRVEYQRNGLRYTSDLTDREWALMPDRCRRPGGWGDRGQSICARSYRRSSTSCRRAEFPVPDITRVSICARLIGALSLDN